MEISIERFPNENDYLVRVGNRVTITTTNAKTDSDIRQWLKNIQRIYSRKIQRRNLVVGFAITTDINNSARPKDEPYDYLFQICVEDYCLVCEIDELRKTYSGRSSDEKWNPIALKDFLHSSAVTVVGVGIENLAKKMEKGFGWVMPKLVELRDLAAANVTPLPPKGFKRYSLAKLARVLLPGEDNDVIIANFAAKPSNVSWWIFETRRPNEEMVKYATMEVFLASQMGMQLLRTHS